MKHLLLSIIATTLLSTAYANPPASDERSPVDKVALVRIEKAVEMFRHQHFAQSKDVLMQVLKTEGTSNKVKASAFLLMGEIGITTQRYDVADVSYENVLKLRPIPLKAIRLANEGLSLSHRREAEQAQQTR